MNRISLSGTSMRVVKMRTADPTNEKDHDASDSCPVWPCLKLVIIWGMRADRPNAVLIRGTMDCIYVGKAKGEYGRGEEVNEAGEGDKQKGIANEHCLTDVWIGGVSRVKGRDDPNR